MDSFRTANQELPSEGGSADLDDFQDAPSTLRPSQQPMRPQNAWQAHAQAVQAALFDQVCAPWQFLAGLRDGVSSTIKIRCHSCCWIQQHCQASPSCQVPPKSADELEAEHLCAPEPYLSSVADVQTPYANPCLKHPEQLLMTCELSDKLHVPACPHGSYSQPFSTSRMPRLHFLFGQEYQWVTSGNIFGPFHLQHANELDVIFGIQSLFCKHT